MRREPLGRGPDERRHAASVIDLDDVRRQPIECGALCGSYAAEHQHGVDVEVGEEACPRRPEPSSFEVRPNPI
jgi:hypothetical protein